MMLLAGLLALPLALTPPADERLTAEKLDHWLEFLQPRANELAWREVGWLDSFGEAVRIAQSEERPILLWAMNGHPLGCT